MVSHPSGHLPCNNISGLAPDCIQLISDLSVEYPLWVYDTSSLKFQFMQTKAEYLSINVRTLAIIINSSRKNLPLHIFIGKIQESCIHQSTISWAFIYLLNHNFLLIFNHKIFEPSCFQIMGLTVGKILGIGYLIHNHQYVFLDP